MDFHRIWIKQCEAAAGIRRRFGKESSLRYLIGEKFLNFLNECDRRPEFAEELPKFALKVMEIFEPQEISGFLEDLLREGDFDPGEEVGTRRFRGCRDRAAGCRQGSGEDSIN